MNLFAILFSLLAFFAGYILWADALGNWMSSLLGSVALLVLLAVLSVIFLIRVLFFKKGGDRPRRWGPLIVFSILVGLCLLTILGHGPFLARVYLSKSSLDDFASRTIAGPPQENINKRVGLFRVKSVARGKGWLAFPFSREAALLKNGLLVYNLTPQDWTATGFLKPLAGHWYWTLIDDAGLESLFGVSPSP